MLRFTGWAIFTAALCFALPAGARELAPAGPKPVYGAGDCARMAGAPAPRESRSDDEAALLAAVPAQRSAQVARTMSGAGDEVVWWIRKLQAINLSTVPSAFHEANHSLDFVLTGCNGERATFVFEGKTYVTDLARRATPPYPIAAQTLPAQFKTSPLGRYETYLVRTPATAGNDFTTLLDELNAYAGAAELELNLAATPLYASFRAEGNLKLDGQVGGTADMMLYVLSYLKVVRAQHPGAWATIRRSPLALQHLQRLWSAGERIFHAAMPYSAARGGLIEYPGAALGAIYSAPFIGELDQLGIRHEDGAALTAPASAPARPAGVRPAPPVPAPAKPG